MSDLKDILQQNKGQLPEAVLMAYLDGTLPPDQQRQVEQWLAEEGMESDALEGLQSLDTKEAKHIVAQLNHGLHHSLDKKRRRPIGDNRWGMLAIVVIALLAVLAYYVVYLSVRK